MAVKAGKIITVGNGQLISRLQTAGSDSVNIPTETIKETGNELNVSIRRDTPDLSFSLESLDATIDTEASLCNIDPSTLDPGDILLLTMAQPYDVVAPYINKATKVAEAGAVYPYLYLESASYRYGISGNATQTFALRGDSQYVGEQIPYRETFAGDGVEDTFTFAHTAIKTVEKGVNLYALGVCVYLADGSTSRLFVGADFTNTSAGIVLNNAAAAPTGSTVAICYFSSTPISFLQTVHPTPTAKPGALRGQDIDLYVAVGPQRLFTGTTTSGDATLVGTGFTAANVGAHVTGAGIPAGTLIGTYTDATHVEMADAAGAPVVATASASVSVVLDPPLIRWDGVQTVEINWRVQLDYNKELGNAHNVDVDYDTPEVSGTYTLRPGTNAKLFAKYAQVTGAAPTEISNLLSSNPLQTRVVLHHPDTGAALKAFRVMDTRIQPGGVQARVNQKVEPSFPWGSDSGSLEIAKGDFLVAA